MMGGYGAETWELGQVKGGKKESRKKEKEKQKLRGSVSDGNLNSLSSSAHK